MAALLTNFARRNDEVKDPKRSTVFIDRKQ